MCKAVYVSTKHGMSNSWLVVVAAFFMFLGFVVFAAKVGPMYTLTYGFAFAVITFLVFIGAGVGGIMQMKNTGILPGFGTAVQAIG